MPAVAAIVAQLAGALAAVHAAGVIHCDVKPTNVFVMYEPGLDGWPRTKLIDFGVARRLDEVLAPGDTIFGTPSFMAPEQWRGAPSTKSDVYSLGCMMYELVTGEPVFLGTLPQLMAAHVEELPPRPSRINPGVPAEIERVIVRALAKDPGMRPAMTEIQHEITRWLQHTPTTANVRSAS